MARNKRKAIRAVSPATAARLKQVVGKLGSDVLQPPVATMNEAWARNVMAQTRDVVENALKAMAGGTAGFDYGPLGKTMLCWTCINRLARYPDPNGIWVNIKAGLPVGPVPKGKKKATIPAAPVATPAAPAAPVAQPVAPVAQPVAPAAPVTGGDVPAPAAADVEPVAAAASKRVVGPSPAELAHPEWDWKPASKVFGVRGLKGNIAVWPLAGDAKAHVKTPEIDPHFEWSVPHLQWMIFCANETPARGAWAWGIRGAGKTTFAEQFAAHTGRPFFPIVFTEAMEPMDFIGDMGASMSNGNGGSVWQDGVATMALRCPIPAVILLDEISLAKAGHITGPLNDMVHPKCFLSISRTGERIDFEKGHLFMAADNTNGTGDISGMHEGTKMMNRATMDRFGYFLRFTKLSKQQEVRLLQNRSLCDALVAEQVWQLLEALRQKVASGQATDPPSIREAVAMAAALRGGFDEKEAFEAAFVGKYPEEMQEDMRVTFTAVFFPEQVQPAA